MAEGRWLSTWKQIGNYLGVSAKSAKRKAKTGMPIHYDGPIPTANTLELDEWRRGSQGGQTLPKPYPNPDTPL